MEYANGTVEVHTVFHQFVDSLSSTSIQPIIEKIIQKII